MALGPQYIADVFRGNRQIASPLRVVRVGFAETVSDGERGLMTDKRCGQVARGGRPAPILRTGVTWMGRSLAEASELAPPRAAMAAGAIQGLLADNEPTGSRVALMPAPDLEWSFCNSA